MTAQPHPAGPQAALRVARTISVVAAVGTLVFLALAIGPIFAANEYLHTGFNLAAAAAVFAIPPVIAVVGLFVELPTLRRLLGSYALLYVVVVIAWVPAMNEPLPPGLAPWPLEVTALATVPAAVAWSPRWVWAYLVVNSVLIAPVRYLAAGQSDLSVPLQFAFFTLAFSAIFTALAIVAMRNGYALDAATEVAHETTARAAAAASRAREQARLDALVHDNVLGTLFYASRGGIDESVRRQATRTLAQLELLRHGRHQLDEPVSSDDLVARIRAEVLDASPDITFTAVGTHPAPIPHDVAAAFTEATSEAVRNSIAHAGDPTSAALSTRMELTEKRVQIVVSDDGIGFDSREVPPHRLGIVVSIRGRFDAIPSGSATVSTSPGAGTVVTMSWDAS